MKLSAGIVAGCMALAGPALAVDDVAVHGDWSVFQTNEPKECWVASAPKSWKAVNDGADVTKSVKRGDIVLYVTFRPSKGVSGEVAYTGGYPFAASSEASVNVGGAKYAMFTDGEYAWPSSAAEDQKFIAAFKGGASATITARSGRGTVTTDNFSLKGFTAAFNDAASRCK